MDYEDLPQEAQDAFDEAADEFAGSADEISKQKYADGVQRAVDNNTYAEGLADTFNMDASDFSNVTGLWEDGVADTDADEWEQALERAGISEKFRDNLVSALTD